MIYKVENINNKLYSDDLFNTAYNNMSVERQHRADRYIHTEDKRLCVFSDMLLRNMLKTYGVSDPIFSSTEKGKPVLVNSDLHFNISHSKSLIACVIDTRPVGIDIQCYKDLDLDRIRNKICTDEENQFILNSTDSADYQEHLRRFCMIWTAKEAYLKYTGEGISGELKHISVANQDGMKEKLGDNISLFCVAEKDYALSVVTENPINN